MFGIGTAQRLKTNKQQIITHSLVLLKMGKIIFQIMLNWLELLISRYCCI